MGKTIIKYVVLGLIFVIISAFFMIARDYSFFYKEEVVGEQMVETVITLKDVGDNRTEIKTVETIKKEVKKTPIIPKKTKAEVKKENIDTIKKVIVKVDTVPKSIQDTLIIDGDTIVKDSTVIIINQEEVGDDTITTIESVIEFPIDTI